MIWFKSTILGVAEGKIWSILDDQTYTMSVEHSNKLFRNSEIYNEEIIRNFELHKLIIRNSELPKLIN